MHKVKGLYYCQLCKKDVDVDISATILAVYDPVKIEVAVHVYCDECKTPLDKEIELIILRD